MSYIATINSNNPEALEVINYLKTLDFVKVTKKKIQKNVTVTSEVLEEDENGIPLKFKDKIMAMSKQANRNMTKRWEAAIAKEEKNIKYDSHFRLQYHFQLLLHP